MRRSQGSFGGDLESELIPAIISRHDRQWAAKERGNACSELKTNGLTELSAVIFSRAALHLFPAPVNRGQIFVRQATLPQELFLGYAGLCSGGSPVLKQLAVCHLCRGSDWPTSFRLFGGGRSSLVSVFLLTLSLRSETVVLAFGPESCRGQKTL